MDRRGVLKGLVAATGVALWPGWARKAFAGGVFEGVATLVAAVERARARLQPLLVFVIPEDDRAKYYRGRHFGEWLNHGGDADLAPLACAEVVCAGMDTVRRLFSGAPPGDEPAILMVDVQQPSMALELVLPAFPHRDLTVEEELAGRGRPSGDGDKDEEAEISACIRAAGEAVRRAVFGDPDALARRARERWDHLTSGARAEVRRIYDGVDGTQEMVLAAAPLLAVDAAEGSREAMALLAHAARVRYCGQPIPGSEWAQTEEDGQIPARSQRFLYFPSRSFQDS
jgi:hypothetical protein